MKVNVSPTLVNRVLTNIFIFAKPAQITALNLFEFLVPWVTNAVEHIFRMVTGQLYSLPLNFLFLTFKEEMQYICWSLLWYYVYLSFSYILWKYFLVELKKSFIYPGYLF